MRISQQLQLFATIIVVSIALVAGTAYLSVMDFSDRGFRVVDSMSTMEKVQSACYHLTYAVANQREYLITDKDSYLDRFRAQIDITKEILRALRDQIKNDHEEMIIFEKFEEAMFKRIASLEATTEAYESKGQAEAFKLIQERVGYQYMDQVMNLAAQLIDFEKRQYATLETQCEDSLKLALMTITLGSLLLALIICIPCYFIFKECRQSLDRLLRASSNVARERFESRLEVSSNNEFGVLGRSISNLAGLLKAKSSELDTTKQALAEVSKKLNASEKENEVLSKSLQELNSYAEEEILELRLGTDSLNKGERDLSESISLADQTGTIMRQVMDFSRGARVCAETVSHHSSDLNRDMQGFIDKAEHVSKSVSQAWQIFPETKELVYQLEALDNELSMLDLITSVKEIKVSNENEVVVISERLKGLKNSLMTTRRALTINISQMQQTIREAVDSSSDFSTTLKGATRHVDSMAKEIEPLLASTFSSSSELTHLDRVYQRLLNSLDDIRSSLSEIGESLSKEEAFAARLKLRAQNAALQRAMQQELEKDKLDNLEKETASLG
ncbi:MAG: CHASE3 domain-containing protein [Candidatus Melainabacteria bacterium]|nr:CHASE3 domain-containing protein [Candidatus Melainabacteria bacterium]